MPADADVSSSSPRRRRPRGGGPPRLVVTVTDGRGRTARAPGLSRWLAEAAPRSARGEVGVALVSSRRIRDLNRTYRRKDAATDVLSFPVEDDEGALGDLVIALPVARRQAREAGHSLATELRVLALHGLLHLLGHDHERDHGEMARLERRLRRRAGLAEGLIERGHAR